MKIAIIVGTRPEIIKMSSVIKELENKGSDYFILHTGQHYSYEMDEIFFEELELSAPKYNLDVGPGSHAEVIGKMLIGIEKILLHEMPDVVLVEGDTNSVLAGTLSATKLGIKVGHVEAGLRSYDMNMPEEQNRRLTDHVSSFLFAPTIINANILRRENIWGEIFVTGNTIIDACLEYMPIAEKRSKILNGIRFDEFALATTHRSENVDNSDILSNFIKIFTECPIPVVYPIHPRTTKRLKEFGLYEKLASNDNVQLIEPMGYFDFLILMKHCSFILTDSGGIQEEATAPNIRKKVFILRENTERPEAVEAGYAEICGTDANNVLGSISKYTDNPILSTNSCIFGDGKTGKTIISILEDEYD